MKKMGLALALLLMPTLAWAKGPVISGSLTEGARNLSHAIWSYLVYML